jgi:hypothetical protein
MHLKYPKNLSIEGKIFVQFVVDVDGSMHVFHLKNDFCPVLIAMDILNFRPG